MKYEKFSLFFGIAGLITNILMISYDGAPIGVGLGILGMGCAIASKETSDDGKFSKKAKTGLIVSIVALAFGLLIFAMQIMGLSILTDPALSKEVLSKMDEMIEMLPESIRPQFEEALKQFR